MRLNEIPLFVLFVVPDSVSYVSVKVSPDICVSPLFSSSLPFQGLSGLVFRGRHRPSPSRPRPVLRTPGHGPLRAEWALGLGSATPPREALLSGLVSPEAGVSRKPRRELNATRLPAQLPRAQICRWSRRVMSRGSAPQGGPSQGGRSEWMLASVFCHPLRPSWL